MATTSSLLYGHPRSSLGNNSCALLDDDGTSFFNAFFRLPSSNRRANTNKPAAAAKPTLNEWNGHFHENDAMMP
jgi:hypothetical protein